MNHGRWPLSMVWLHGPPSTVQFLTIFKAIGPLAGFKLNVDQEEWHAPESKCADFFSIRPKAFGKLNWKIYRYILSGQFLVFCCNRFLSFKIKYHWTFTTTIFLYYGPLHFPTRAPLLPSHRKTSWTMSVHNVGLIICLLGTSNSMVSLTDFPWLKRKWSRDVFYMALGRLHFVHGKNNFIGAWLKIITKEFPHTLWHIHLATFYVVKWAKEFYKGGHSSSVMVLIVTYTICKGPKLDT